MNHNFEKIRHNSVGTVEFVSTKEIKVLLEIDAPMSTSLNTGVPQQFPRINGFLLIPNEAGALIGMITWIAIEYSPYPKRKGYRDFELVDLPFPLRKLSLTPLGILKETENGYEIERGVYSYPCVGDAVIIPTQEQLKAIVQNKDKNAEVMIGTSPLAGNAPIYINPDKLFGRHLAILGNTGSGKSCSVAGLIRWSIEAAKNKINEPEEQTEQNEKEAAKNKINEPKVQTEQNEKKEVNARFIILDPNGEYEKCFDDLGNVKKYEVKIREEGNTKQLKVPSWMWNSWEWASIAQASARTQRPLLRRALREIKNADEKKNVEDKKIRLRRYYTSILIEFKNDLNKGCSAFKGKPGKNDFGKKLKSIINDLTNDLNVISEENINSLFKNTKDELEKIEKQHFKTFTNEKNEQIEYYDDFEKDDLETIIKKIEELLDSIGGLLIYEGPDEDSPVFFKNEDFLAHIERLAQEANQQQYLDFFLMRVRSLFTDKRIASVINTEKADEITTLQKWLEEYIGSNDKNPSITIIDLSLLPSEILYLVVSVMARIIFEAHHRYKKQTGETLPTVLVVDEAHNLVKKYETDDDNISSQRLCTQIFEKIAKEGRKFGLGLVLSSQRPSELSQTVLSQCNTFLLHRIVSDRDQEMVKKLVPDTMGNILNELSVLPSRKAILLGWATPIPVLVEMNELPKDQRPASKDPDFWKIWINEEKREINWKKIADEWQQKGNDNEQ